MSAPSPCHRPNWAQRSEFSCGFHKRTGEAYASPPREFYKTLQIYCGSEPARESGMTISIDAGCDGLIASRLAPTLGIRCCKYRISA
ncbi:hypothetical protein EMIT0194P_30304 [Pseudomonas serbica]